MKLLFMKAARHHLDLFNVPSPAQLEAGNYKKKHRKFAGLDVTIENPRGSIRRGTDKGGKAWETPMHHDYGYIKGTLGVDGDHYDCYLGPHEAASHAYLVTTKAPPEFTADDEQKAMLGFHCEDAARDAYLAHYDNPKFCGRIDAVPMDRFRREVRTTRANPRMLKALVAGYTREDGTKVAGYVNRVQPNVDPQRVIPWTRITGDEVQLGDHKTMRDAAKAYGDTRLVGTTSRNEESGLDVRFNVAGIKHTVRHGSEGFPDPEDHHRKAVAALPELIRQATLHASEPDKKARADILAVHKMAAPLLIGTTPYVANITVREGRDEGAFYDHYLRLLPIHPPAPVGSPAQQAGTAGADGGMNVGMLREVVNHSQMSKAALIVFK